MKDFIEWFEALRNGGLNYLIEDDDESEELCLHLRTMACITSMRKKEKDTAPKWKLRFKEAPDTPVSGTDFTWLDLWSQHPEGKDPNLYRRVQVEVRKRKALLEKGKA